MENTTSTGSNSIVAENLLTREQFQQLLETLNLENQEDRIKINNIVIDEVVESQFKFSWMEVKGFPSLNTSSMRYLRPVPTCVWGKDGWTVKFMPLWFIN